MTPTEQVRAKLDDHGVEWHEDKWTPSCTTYTKTREGNEIEIHECVNGTFTVYNLTPEQAARIGVFLS